MLIREINKNFLLPIEFDKYKKKIYDNLYEDLELLKTHTDTIPVYQKIFRPTTAIGKEFLKKLPEHFTTNAKFLEDSQKITKNMNNNDFLQNKDIVNDFWTHWEEIKNTEDFLEKFQYIEWEKLEFLNKSSLFLAILTFYELASPILSLFAPLILFIIPFIILKILKIPITIENYGKTLIQQLDKHPIGQVFTRFEGLSWSQRSYLLLCAGMYIYQIYQNILSCYHFYINTSQINDTFKSMTIYLKHTINKLKYYVDVIQPYESYDEYKSYIKENLNELTSIYNVVSNIPTTSLNPTKMFSFGKIMKEFYVLQTCFYLTHIQNQKHYYFHLGLMDI